MRKVLIPLVALLPLLAGGCIVKAAADVVTLPVRAGAKAVDWTTTSQDEADRNYGRKMRKQEAEDGKARRKYEKECRKRGGDCPPYSGDPR
ncbi:hypothetical protein ACG3SL_00750 [Sphingomonas sp. CJ20]